MILAQQSNRPLVEFSLDPIFHPDTGIPLAIMGILVVFSALALVVTFITVLPRALSLIFTVLRALSLISPMEDEQEVPVLSLNEDELPQDIVVVIAAAVAAVIDQPQRIVHIRGLTSADLGWSLEGRTQQHQSHRIQTRGRQ